MPKRKQTPDRSREHTFRGLWQYRDQWLERDPKSPNFYRCWYDAGAGRNRRRSLGTSDFTEAQKLLIASVEGDAPKDPLAPDQVYFAAVRNFYMEGHGNFIRSKDAAERAFTLVLDYLKKATSKQAPVVADFSLARQEAFMRWCRDEHELSPKSIYTYLSTIRAAMNYCAVPRIITDSKGEEREAKVLATPFYIANKQDYICKVTGLPKPKARDFIPKDAQVAAFLDATYDENEAKQAREREHYFRYCIIALNTWARPEAICDLNVAKQVDFDNGLIDLNPPGRLQTRKYRPVIRLTDCLRAWLLYWNLERPIVYFGEPIARISNHTFDKIAIDAKVAEMIPYSLRHYMNTRSMRVPKAIRPDREERATWMGHHDERYRTTMTYEHLDPEYLENAAKATDAIMQMLDKLTAKALFAPNTVRPGLHVVEKRA